MLYAIISDGGRQLKVEEGQTLDIDFRDIKAGEQIKFDRVLRFATTRASRSASRRSAPSA